MLGTNRILFNSPGNSPYSKFGTKMSVIGDFVSTYPSIPNMPFYYRMPGSGFTTTMGDSGNIVGTGMAADGFGWCGAVTFKYKTQSNYVWGDTFWSDPDVERIRAYGSGDYTQEYFMVDGVLKKDLTSSPEISNYYPITIGRKKSTYELAITTEYGEFAAAWFNNTFDTYANRWLTLVWSHAYPGAIQNFSHEVSKYGSVVAWKNAEMRYALYDALTGELLETTDKQTSDSIAGGGSGYGFMDYSSVTDWTFTQDWSSGTYDVEVNNNNGSWSGDGEMIYVSSVWHSIGGSSVTYGISEPFDPLYFYREKDYSIIGNYLPKTILGRNALVNLTVQYQDSTYWYGFRDAICGVSSPANAASPWYTDMQMQIDYP